MRHLPAPRILFRPDCVGKFGLELGLNPFPALVLHHNEGAGSAAHFFPEFSDKTIRLRIVPPIRTLVFHHKDSPVSQFADNKNGMLKFKRNAGLAGICAGSARQWAFLDSKINRLHSSADLIAFPFRKKRSASFSYGSRLQKKTLKRASLSNSISVMP